jgi:hypothetical protein
VRKSAAAPRIRAERIPANELTDSQIERIIGFGRQEADVVDQISQAARTGDRDKVWQLAQELVRLEDQARRP